MKDWEPPLEAWDKFLSLLDADRDKAGEKYEAIQRKLITFFECRRCLAPEQLADVSINRVIRRYFEGEVINTLMGYVYGVAKIVYLEHLAEQRNEQDMQAHLAYTRQPTEADSHSDTLSDALYVCFDGCMEELPKDDQEFIKQYYEESRRKKIDNRKSMAEGLRISQNALVLRAFHIRKRLKRCIDKCLKNNPE